MSGVTGYWGHCGVEPGIAGRMVDSYRAVWQRVQQGALFMGSEQEAE